MKRTAPSEVPPPSFTTTPPASPAPGVQRRKQRVRPLDARARSAHAAEQQPAQPELVVDEAGAGEVVDGPVQAPPAPPMPLDEVERHVARICRCGLYGVALFRRAKGLEPMALDAVPSMAAEAAKDFAPELAEYSALHRAVRIVSIVSAVVGPFLRAAAARPVQLEGKSA